MIVGPLSTHRTYGTYRCAVCLSICISRSAVLIGTAVRKQYCSRTVGPERGVDRPIDSSMQTVVLYISGPYVNCTVIPFGKGLSLPQ